MKVNVKVEIAPMDTITSKRKLGPGLAVQRFVDNEVMRLSHPYIPFDMGMLARSSISSTNVGSGIVYWDTPYARKQYYEHQMKGKWFEVMKSQHKDQILRGAAKIAGGKSER